MKICEIFFFFISLSTFNSLNEPFNFTEFQSMNRILNPILSPDDKYIVYSVQKWNPTTNKLYTNNSIFKSSIYRNKNKRNKRFNTKT